MATTTDQERRNVETTHRIAEEIWNQGNLDVIDDCYAEDAVIHSGFREYHGPEGYREWVGQSRTGFPDFHIELHEVLATDDLVATYFTWTGTHDGRLAVLDAEPTNASLEVSGVVLVRYDDDGNVIEERNFSDSLSMLGQIGMLPADLAP